MGMIILGILCRKWKLLDQSGVNNMKTLVTNIMLPVAIFVGLCLRYYGGSFRVVSSDSGHEDFRESGASCFFAGCGRILLRDPVFDVS